MGWRSGAAALVGLTLTIGVGPPPSRALAAAPPLVDYAKPSSAVWLTLSPSGDRLAYFDLSGDEPRLLVRQVGGPTLVALESKDFEPDGINWLGEDHILIRNMNTISLPKPGGQKNVLLQTIVLNVDTHKTISVFNNHADIFPSTFGYCGFLQDAGRAYGFFRGISLYHGCGDASCADLYKVDLDTGNTQLVAHGENRNLVLWLVTADGVAAHESIDRQARTWRLYDRADDHALIAEGKDLATRVGIWGRGRTPDSVLLFRQEDALSGGTGAIEYQLSAGSSGVKVFGDEPVTRPIWEATNDLLIGKSEFDSVFRTTLFDPALQSIFDKASRALGTDNVNLESATSRLNRMIVSTSGPSDSGTYFLVDAATHKIEPIAWTYPTITPDKMGPVQVVNYRAADGMELQGILTLPPDRKAKRLPLVVFPHPAGQSDAAMFDWKAQAFASRGYAVFQPNYRGSTNFGKAFEMAGLGQWGRKIQTDISDGVAELAREGVVDDKRACIMGEAMGGYAALAGVTLQQGLYRCAVAISAASNLKALYQRTELEFHDDSPQVHFYGAMLGVNSARDPALDALSPERLAGRVTVPIFLIHSKDDAVIPISQSYNMRDALKAAGKQVEMLEIAGDQPLFASRAVRTQMLLAEVAFIEKYNPPG